MSVDPREMVEDIRYADGVAGGITLSAWEEEFVESIENRLNEGLGLIGNQFTKLQEIWDRI